MSRYVARHARGRAPAPDVVERAVRVQAELCAQDESWGTSGWTRRRFVGGAGMVGAAALAAQFVTTRTSYADTTTTPDANTVIVIFMRGAADGLRILSPHSSDLGLDYLQQVRPTLVPTAPIALPGQNGWALNAALQPVYDQLWATGELAFVPAVSDPDIPRSHFEAQQYLELGGTAAASTGWLDRVLGGLGPGTTFRAVSEGSAQPLSMAGDEPSLVVNSINDFALTGSSPAVLTAREAALRTLYRGLDGLTLAEDVPTTLGALDVAASIKSAGGVQNGAVYPANNAFANSLKDLAAILHAEVGLQVATVDVGGWDTHTDEVHDLDANLASMGQALSAFFTDLGPDRRKRVTVVVQTEFGRRVAANGSGGSDHGHGSVMWLLGGGLTGSAVRGSWSPLSDGVLDQGDVPGLNNPFDVLGEVVSDRLGAGSLGTVFPRHTIAPLGLTSAA